MSERNYYSAAGQQPDLVVNRKQRDAAGVHKAPQLEALVLHVDAVAPDLQPLELCLDGGSSMDSQALFFCHCFGSFARIFARNP